MLEPTIENFRRMVGEALFDITSRLCSANVLPTLNGRRIQGKSCFTYGYLMLREGARTPFDRNHSKWQGIRAYLG